MRNLTHAETAVLAHIIAALPDRFPFSPIHQKGMPAFSVPPGDARAALRSLRQDRIIEKDGPFVQLCHQANCELHDVIASLPGSRP